MALNIGKELTALKRMTVPELRRKYAQVFGEDTTSRHKEFLIRRIVWKLQVNQEGGLSERARQRARELAGESDIRLTAPRPRPVVPGGEATTAHVEFPQDERLPMPGAIITRRYKNQTIEVRVSRKRAPPTSSMTSRATSRRGGSSSTPRCSGRARTRTASWRCAGSRRWRWASRR